MKSLIIITGTTRGLGNALETELLLDKSNHVLSINRTDHLENTQHHTNVHIDLSIMSQDDIEKYKKILLDLLKSNKFSKIFFINNAFSISPLGTLHTLNNKEIIDSLHINILSAILLLKTFIAITQDIPIEKIIINISSGAAKYAIDKWSIYCLSKASIEMFVKSIEKEYSEIFSIYNIDPGTIDTSMQEKIRLTVPENKYFLDLKTKKLLNEPQTVAKDILKKVGL